MFFNKSKIFVPIIVSFRGWLISPFSIKNPWSIKTEIFGEPDDGSSELSFKYKPFLVSDIISSTDHDQGDIWIWVKSGCGLLLKLPLEACPVFFIPKTFAQ